MFVKEELEKLQAALHAFRTGEFGELLNLTEAWRAIDEVQLLLAQTDDSYLMSAWFPTQQAAIAVAELIDVLERLDHALDATLRELPSEEGTPLADLDLPARVHVPLWMSFKRVFDRPPFVEDIVAVLKDKGEERLQALVWQFGPKAMAELKEKLQEHKFLPEEIEED